MPGVPDSTPRLSTRLDPVQVNEFIETFEAFCRNPAAPLAEKTLYFFDDLRPPYFFPDAVLAEAQHEPITDVTVETSRQASQGHELIVTFGQRNGNELIVSRSAEAASHRQPFNLSYNHAGLNQDPRHLGSIRALHVGKFLVGLSIGHDNRQLLRLEESKGVPIHGIDPQSAAYLQLIAMGLEQNAIYSKSTKKYQLFLRNGAGSQRVDIETTLVSTGHCEYEMQLSHSDIDGSNLRAFDMSVAISHQYGRDTSCQADISGSSTLTNDLEIFDHNLSADTLSVYGLAALRAVTPRDVAVESLRKFWQ